LIVYSEKKDGQRSTFTKTILNESHEIQTLREVSLPLYRIEHTGYVYFILYDDEMVPIAPVYQYLNFNLRGSPITSRSKAAVALRLLYCFLSLSGCKDTEISELTFKELLFFLRGINTNPEQYSMKTQRSNNTVNGYLSVYRSYFDFAGITCDALYRSRVIADRGFSDDTPTIERTKYESNLRISGLHRNTVTKYISPDDFRRIYRAMAEAKDKQAMIIAHLMYGYGLRLGEVLGVTTEDIREYKVDGRLAPVIVIRNRMSDAKFQFAKGLPHVLSHKEYRTKDYNAASQRIILTYRFYEELINFIEEQHGEIIEKYPENYAMGIADIASTINKPETNHYVFLNRYGRILSDQTWNNSLRKYFKIAGIPIDIECRENNLSHRFRHGFAMFHARFSEHRVGALELQKLMRHRSITSTMVYYNPTPEDEFNIKMEYQQELYDMIPELKEGLRIDNI
jgi:integrase/recombinase XerD